MVSIRVNPTSDNVRVDVLNVNSDISVIANQENDSVNTGVVGDKYYSDLAKEWAIKMDGKVLGQDYSSKYYATQAVQSIDEFIENLAVENNLEVTKDGRNVTIKNPTYVHEQGVASDTWSIEHNLNKYPSVTLVDSAGTQFQGRVEYTDENNCIVYMNGATKGKAYLN